MTETPTYAAADPNTAWRVWMIGPGGASCEQFPELAAAEQFAAGVRRRHPDWDVEVVPWNIPGSAR